MGVDQTERAGLPKVIKKRAPRACESCRVRKVRCDVTKTKSPCTNCKLDCKTCILPVSKRRHVGDRVVGSLATTGNPHSPICDAIIDFGDLETPSSTTSKVTSPDLNDKTMTDISFDDLLLESTSGHGHEGTQFSWENMTWDFKSPTHVEPKTEPFSAYPSPAQSVKLEPCIKPCTLPAYITPLPKTLQETDAIFLQSRGCFTIPPDSARDELLRCYAKWVHPFTPMLDFAEIVNTIFGWRSTETVSLLLLQSMLLAASAYTDLDLGLGDRKETRQALYERCRLLYDFDVESDRVSLLHSAILMSFWDGSMDQVRDSYHWIGVASLHAESIRFDLEVESCPTESDRKRLLKRTWWSLLIRDRLLAVALRRPAQVKALSSMAVLDLGDFDNDSIFTAMADRLDVDDTSIADLDMTSTLCISLAQLSGHLAKILSTQYIVQKRNKMQNGRQTSMMTLVPKCVGGTWTDFDECGLDLQAWYRQLPLSIQGTSSARSRDESALITVHRSLVTAYHATALMTLYRPIHSGPAAKQVQTRLRMETTKALFKAAKTITSSLANLCSRDLLCKVPDTAIASLDSAIVTHLLHSMSGTDSVRESSSQRFYLCWRMLLNLGEIYPMADTTIAMVNVAAKVLRETSFRTSVKPTRQVMMPRTNPPQPQTIDMTAFANMGVTLEPSKESDPWSWYDSREFLAQKTPSSLCDDVEDGNRNMNKESDLFEQMICWDPQYGGGEDLSA
ncbi:hypothetical protein PV10_04205 [Exophiala mesophila]|uniref:Zn(2)-C6 fungal-type domain-containing protein n=1 Tax=Exophiala mesophila TaxID=212818 RepID=A0A0D1ZGL8_EXOME|nr:uncharacterized protein PV10_04205 [Exophiala mesophila]KIV92954.1 hypothetical protein PV10_04205 [Exophiala mesophila]